MIRLVQSLSEWNNFALKVKPVTFLHSWQWGEVQEKNGDRATRLGYFDKDRLMGLAQVIQVRAKRGNYYFIPHGPIAESEKIVKVVIAEVVQYLKKEAKKDKVCALRVASLLLKRKDNELFFKKNNFIAAPMHVHAELTWVLDINQSEDKILQGMRKTTRHAIKKAEKRGVVTEVVRDKIIDRFWQMYVDTGNRHHFVPWSRKMIASQLDIFKRQNMVYGVFASLDNRDIAGAIIFEFSDTAYYYHGASIFGDKSVPAGQAVQWEALKEAKRKGLKKYNFWGIAPDDKPDHPFAGITVFKKGFGGKAIDYMHAQDLPLSIGYAKLWVADTLRKYKRGF